MAVNTAIVWFRRDLRLADNPALQAAIADAKRVIALYIHTPEDEAPWQPGAASRWWLHHSLTALDAQLHARGSQLTIRAGDSLAELEDVIASCAAGAVFWNKLYEPALHARDLRIANALQKRGIEVSQHNATLLFEPGQVLTNGNAPYTVFTPYWRKALSQLQLQAPRPAPKNIPGSMQLKSLPVAKLNLLPEIPWDSGLHATWTPGENGAQQRLSDFITAGLSGYAARRDRPDQPGTSRLSPHLHFGELSPHQAAWAASQSAIDTARADAGCAAFLRELGWREFAQQLLFHFPHTVTQPLRSDFADFPWQHGGGKDFEAWCRGRTGIPLIDAGMRELWHTGWMHNRVRMVVASFLTKNQLISWQSGAAWFWDTLVDADLANNTLGWQWSAGCGADAAPFFRIFNPVTQSERFDPDATYIRKWCPELAALPPRAAHSPWRATASELAGAGIEQGINYPLPIVDLALSRKIALETWQIFRDRS